MEPIVTLLACQLVLVISLLALGIKRVGAHEAVVVERMGRYHRTLGPGWAVLIPFIDRLVARFDLRPQVLTIDEAPFVVGDSTVMLRLRLHWRVVDPQLATYEVHGARDALVQLVLATLRNHMFEVPKAELERELQALSRRPPAAIEEASAVWGLRLEGLELEKA